MRPQTEAEVGRGRNSFVARVSGLYSWRRNGGSVWICLVALWQRWWPDRVCLELLDDKVQAGYGKAAENVLDAGRRYALLEDPE